MSEIIDKVAKQRYLRGDEKIMDHVYFRVAHAVAKNVNKHIYPRGESPGSMSDNLRLITWEARFHTLMAEGIFLPNTPTLSNAGTDCEMLSACFGLPVNDSFEGRGGIYDTLTTSARLLKMGGGVGYNFSTLRAKGARVKSTDGVASGPVSFMQLYDANVGTIQQGGRRRGAAIGILNVDHPDIREFITCKAKEGDIKNFNISVMVNDEFMKDVERLNIELEEIGHLLSDTTLDRIKKNKETFDMIVDGIWNNGEPGILFYDAINRDNPNKHLYDITTTNPCGEIPIGVDPETGGGEVCNLGSINVSKFYISIGDHIDWVELQNVVHSAVVFLDTIIDMNEYPTEAVKEMARSTRKIGLGFMGLHDLLIKMGLPYDSDEAAKVAEELMKFIRNCAISTSMQLADKVGSYPKWTNSEWGKKQLPIRNSTMTCVAPTGTISILAECSSGIEPHYNWVYERTNTVGSKFMMCSPLFEEAMFNFVNAMDNETVIKNLLDRYGVIVYELVENGDEWYIQDDDVEYFGNMRVKLVDCIKQECFAKGSIQQIDFIPDTVRKVFRNALDISWEKHIYIQSRIQKWCDNSISKTVNMSADATKDDVRNAIIYAWQQGCKGFTMYRESSRKDVVMKLKEPEKIEVEVNQPVKAGQLITGNMTNTSWVLPPEFYEHIGQSVIVPAQPVGYYDKNANKWTTEYEEVKNDGMGGSNFKRVLPATRYRVTSGCGDLYIHVAEQDGRVREVFVNCGGSGGCAANNNAIGRLISLALKHKVPIRDIIRQLKKVKCDACIKNGSRAEGKSCADVIGRVLEESIPEEEEKRTETVAPSGVDVSSDKYYTYNGKDDIQISFTGSKACPECGAPINMEGRCITCHNCGYSKCG